MGFYTLHTQIKTFLQINANIFLKIILKLDKSMTKKRWEDHSKLNKTVTKLQRLLHCLNVKTFLTTFLNNREQT